jgi:16S rRNA (cytidine1402-2'-O)-methyltransferase
MRDKIKGHLYLIPVPIDQNDKTSILLPKDKNIVEHLDYFIVENEKTARFYLSDLNLNQPIQSLGFKVIDASTPYEAMLNYLKPIEEGFSIGLLSESGCPAIADPGSKLIAIAHQKKIKVIPMIGPSSMLLALIASGLNGQQFKFHGYLPKDKNKRIKKIKSMENESKKKHETQIFIETPYRNQHVFNDLIVNLQDQTQCCIALDITSNKEHIQTKNISDWKKEEKLDLKNRLCVFLMEA